MNRLFTVDVNVNVTLPGLLPLVQSFLTTLELKMSDITDALATITASNTTLTGKVTELNGKVDGLIVTANTTKDALVALQQNSTTMSDADKAAVQAVIDAQTASVAEITAEEGKVDAANTGIAP